MQKLSQLFVAQEEIVADNLLFVLPKEVNSDENIISQIIYPLMTSLCTRKLDNIDFSITLLKDKC